MAESWSWLKAIAAFACLIAASPAVHAQPADQPIRIVFPFAAGGVGDALARIVADALRQATGQPAIVENRTGAAGRIGVQHARDARPDGSVLLVTPIAPMAIYPLTYPRLDYDPTSDFQPVSQIGTFEFGLAVGPAVPATDLAGLIPWLRANPARTSYGIPGEGTLPHFCAVLFARAAALDLQAIAYKGNAPALADLIGGHLPMFVTSAPDLVEAHRAGRIRVLATSGERRAPSLPDVPTFREAGYAIAGVGWYAVYAPARTPAATVERLSGIVAAAVRNPEAQARMAAFGITPTGTTAAALGEIQAADMALWRPAVLASGFKITE